MTFRSRFCTSILHFKNLERDPIAGTNTDVTPTKGYVPLKSISRSQRGLADPFRDHPVIIGGWWGVKEMGIGGYSRGFYRQYHMDPFLLSLLIVVPVASS